LHCTIQPISHRSAHKPYLQCMNATREKNRFDAQPAKNFFEFEFDRKRGNICCLYLQFILDPLSHLEGLMQETKMKWARFHIDEKPYSHCVLALHFMQSVQTIPPKNLVIEHASTNFMRTSSFKISFVDAKAKRIPLQLTVIPTIVLILHLGVFTIMMQSDRVEFLERVDCLWGRSS
jgi:hypothetical protein